MVYHFPEIGATTSCCKPFGLESHARSNHVSLLRCSNAFQPSGPRRCQFTTSQCAAEVCVGSQRTRDWLAKFGTAPSRDKRPTLSIPSILTRFRTVVVTCCDQWVQCLTNRFQQQTLHISLHKLVKGFGLPTLPFACLFSLCGLNFAFCSLSFITHHFPQATLTHADPHHYPAGLEVILVSPVLQIKASVTTCHSIHC